jgi:hypothetical protein
VKLPKWPRLYVAGETLTEEQADLVIIRTSDVMGLSGNDESWRRMVLRTFGVTVEEDGYPSFEEVEAVRKRYGMMDLQYLGTDRISSCHADGANGWCDWDGTIGCADGHLHSKWPHIDEVFAEWNTIARAFPFLHLTAQLTTGGWERPDDDGTRRDVLAQWEVERGVVRMVSPGPLLHPVPPEDNSWEVRQEEYLARRDAVRRRGWGFEPVSNVFPERGTTWARLKAAVERARVR